jgi:hypothetical protein
VVAGRHEQTDAPVYKTRNWPAYTEALKRRGSGSRGMRAMMRDNDGLAAPELAPEARH